MYPTDTRAAFDRKVRRGIFQPPLASFSTRGLRSWLTKLGLDLAEHAGIPIRRREAA